jgi:hypothetical protein
VQSTSRPEHEGGADGEGLDSDTLYKGADLTHPARVKASVRSLKALGDQGKSVRSTKLAVFVLDKRKKPLMPCLQKRPCLLLTRGRAVRAEVAVIHTGRIPVRPGGPFKVGNADGINAKYCKPLHRADGYGYVWRPALACLAEGLRRGRLG